MRPSHIEYDCMLRVVTLLESRQRPNALNDTLLPRTFVTVCSIPCSHAVQCIDSAREPRGGSCGLEPIYVSEPRAPDTACKLMAQRFGAARNRVLRVRSERPVGTLTTTFQVHSVDLNRCSPTSPSHDRHYRHRVEFEFDDLWDEPPKRRLCWCA